MDLIDTLRSTGAVREFTDEPVDDAVLARVLDTARFAPSGANAQAWRVVVVKDRAIRTRLRDLYLPGWVEYLTLTAAGLRPWSPVNDRTAEAAALAAGTEQARLAAQQGLAAHLDEAPALLALFADLSQLAAVDRDLDHYSLAGGASVYPFAWSILLAARAEGLGGVLTTMLIRQEDEVKRLLGADGPLVLAAVIVLGHPVRQPRRLTRQAVAAFTTVDRVDGVPFSA
ncbi:nitroreductase family protein [Mycolicibacterium sp. CH28]|uniref:nitroreductase family protein n=1 Tax=Mycolicibacterium sp. CH28 TaxID=2512237 RepID=UPI0010810ECF|nr:nitroreductase family protein [Mycolicibacterium sp. CH28]TGD86578.1 nitroreductase family protein [Mycolicibacterium sp. CH28]